MERLTFRIETGEAFTDRAYPCEIPLLKSEIGGIAIAKLADYEDAEENGTLIRLPCKGRRSIEREVDRQWLRNTKAIRAQV